MIVFAAPAVPGAAPAQEPATYAPVAALIRAFAAPDGALGWEQLDARRGVRWRSPRKPLAVAAPDGSLESRPGVVALPGRTLSLAASGSLAGVGSIYIADSIPAADAATVVAGLRQAGIALSPVRCARDPAAVDRSRGWYRVVTRGVGSSLYVGPLREGRQGYTLFFGDPPPMTQDEVAHFVDCRDGRVTPQALSGPQTGQAGLVAVIEALLRPVGTARALPWGASLPVILWNAGGPVKLTRDSFGGADSNPWLLDGHFKTSTTEMTVTATGDDGGASRTAVTCGKRYLKMSENWFRIEAPGRQAAILYRAMSVATGRPTEDYAIRLDDAVPPLQPGQRAAAGGACPG